MTDQEHVGGAKTCRSCGRTIEWRKKCEHNWGEVADCSDKCRRRKVSAIEP